MARAVEIADQYLQGRVLSLDTNGNLVQSVNGAAATLLPVYAEQALQSTEKTIATTGVTLFQFIVPFASTLASVDFSGKDVLAASDTNYILFTGINKGQAGAGTNALLVASAANGTQVTGGTALAAYTKRSLTVNATASNLVLAKGDRIQILATVTGTLANTVTESIVECRFLRTS